MNPTPVDFENSNDCSSLIKANTMTVPDLNPYSGLGGGNGGYWNSLAQAQSSAVNAAYYAYPGAILAISGSSSRAASAPAIEDAGIRAGEIVAYRVWLLKHGFLHSMAASYVWSPQEIETGDIDAGLGIHAFKTSGEAVRQYGWCGDYGSPVVIGRVLLWGDVIEHEKGYRAQFARVDELLALVPEPKPIPKWKFWKEPDQRLANVSARYCQKFA